MEPSLRAVRRVRLSVRIGAANISLFIRMGGLGVWCILVKLGGCIGKRFGKRSASESRDRRWF